MNRITASKLYDYFKCQHRVWRDAHGPENEKIREDNPFLQMLWARGISHEEKIIKGILSSGESALLDLSSGSLTDRTGRTLEALKNNASIIYQGVISADDLLGVPDLLELLPDGKYMPIDIKSGMALEGTSGDDESGGKLKKHYAVQLCLYSDILERMGIPTNRTGMIIDGNGDSVIYDLLAAQSDKKPQTWWEMYENVRGIVGSLIDGSVNNTPALCADCKNCVWQKSCMDWCTANSDLTLLFSMGRRDRDRINEDLKIFKVSELADLNVAEAMKRKSKEKKVGRDGFLRSVGGKQLERAKRRAVVRSVLKKPVAYKKLVFPKVKHELFFDIEDDPTQELVYLHGVYERSEGREKFHYFVSRDTAPSSEKDVWTGFWEYIRSIPVNDRAVYYYSQHERSTYRKLQDRYPDVVSVQELDEFFNDEKAVDLYKMVISCTDWPLSSYSVKELATWLGFKWRDETPSGALSIQWFNDYLESGAGVNKDEKILQRILEYNEDDCKATMVLKDALEMLEVVEI